MKGDLQSITGWIETYKGKEEDINNRDEVNGLNALHYAIIFKKKEIVKALLEYGARADKGSRGRISPLQLTILAHTPFREAIELLTTPPYGYTDIDQVIDDLRWVVIATSKGRVCHSFYCDLVVCRAMLWT